MSNQPEITDPQDYLIVAPRWSCGTWDVYEVETSYDDDRGYLNVWLSEREQKKRLVARCLTLGECLTVLAGLTGVGVGQ